MTEKLIGIAFIVALVSGCFALARSHGPMTYYMDDTALLSQYLTDTQALVSDSQSTSEGPANPKHESR